MYVIGVSMAQRRGNDADMAVMIGEHSCDDVELFLFALSGFVVFSIFAVVMKYTK